MKMIWLLVIFLFLLFTEIIYCIVNNAPECIFARDTITCIVVKNK